MAKMPNPKDIRVSFTFSFFFLFLKGLIQNCTKNKSLSLKICNVGQTRPKVLSQRELKFIHVYFFIIIILLHCTKPHSLTGLALLGFWHFGAWPLNPSLNIL